MDGSRRIILVDPPGWQGAVHGSPAFPNVGIAYLIPPLRAAGWSVRVLDRNNEECSDAESMARIGAFSPAVVGFSCKTATFDAAVAMARMVKAGGGGVKTIFGGPHVTLNYRELLREPDLPIDLLFAGEGEPDIAAAADLLAGTGGEEALKNGRLLRENGRLCYLPERENCVETAFFPDYSDFPENVREHNRENYPLVTSRGCPYGCVYCTVPLVSGERWRSRPVEHIMAELRHAREVYGVTGFQIIDDSWNVNMDRCKAMCREILRDGVPLAWCCPNGIRADRLDAELAGLMKRSGCHFVAVGVESGSPEVFARIGKGTELDKIGAGIRHLRNAGIDVSGFFIIGLPGDSVAEERKSVAFAREHGIRAHFNILTPYLHTAVHGMVERDGCFLRDTGGALHFSRDVSKVGSVFEWPDFSAREMKKCYIRAYLRLGQYGNLIPEGSRWKQGAVLAGLFLRYDPAGIPGFLRLALRRLAGRGR